MMLHPDQAMRNHTCLSSLSALVLASAAMAQNCLYNWGSDPTIPGNTSGLLSPPGQGQVSRQHLLVPAFVFQNVPTRITDLAYAIGSGYRRLRFDELTIRMGHTSMTQLSTTFATNITSPLQTVMSVRDHVCFVGVGPAWAPIGLQSSFLFMPGSGNLLIEVVATGGAVLEGYTPQGASNSLIGGRVNGLDITLPTLGSVAPGDVPRLQLCTDRAETLLFGESCAGSGTSTPLLGVSGKPSPGASPTVWLSDAPPNAPAACAFGFDTAPPFPLLLTSLGAPGCRQYFPVAFADFVLADGVGIGQRTVLIPNAASTIGSVAYAQYFVLDPPANALDLTASNYARLLVGL